VLEEALRKFSIVDARCVHRIGDLAIGDLAVWVGVSAAHRGAAFDACRYIIDEVKSRVPIWKQERYRQGGVDWLHPGDTPSPE
jgi:molybdopterin synthase catalytic subunit